MKHTEMAIQRELVAWLERVYPEIDVMYRRNEGQKSKQSAILDKKAGLKAGVPDLQLIYDKDEVSYILELEIKTKGTDLNKNQKKWFAEFNETKNRIAKKVRDY